MVLLCAAVLASVSTSTEGGDSRLTLEMLASRSTRVALVRVLDVQVSLPEGHPEQMTTLSTLSVEKDAVGKGPERLKLVQLGGKSGLWESHVTGDATFTKGEEALVFLRCPDPQLPMRCSLVGLGQGKLAVSVKGRKERVVAVKSGDQTVLRPLDQVIAELHQLQPKTAKVHR